MPDYRETIIRIDHDTGLADVWTPYPAFQRLMERVKAAPQNRQLAGQWWQAPVKVLSRGIRFGKPRPQVNPEATKANLERLAKARRKVANG